MDKKDKGTASSEKKEEILLPKGKINASAAEDADAPDDFDDLETIETGQSEAKLVDYSVPEDLEVTEAPMLTLLKKESSMDHSKLKEEKEELKTTKKSKKLLRKESEFKDFNPDIEESSGVSTTRIVTSIQKGRLTLEQERAGICTYTITGPFYYQSAVKYKCLSCVSALIPGVTVCKNCADTCHKGHALEALEESFGFCDCGTNSLPVDCQCMPEKPASRHFLTERELLSVRLVFEVIDEDSSGFVSIDELENAISKVDPSLSKEVLDRVMTAIDSDDNGTVSFEEFCGFLFVPFKAAEFLYFIKNGLDYSDALLEAVYTFKKNSTQEISAEVFETAAVAYLDVIEEIDIENEGKEELENFDLVQMLFYNEQFPKWLFLHFSEKTVPSLPEGWCKISNEEISTLFYRTAKQIALTKKDLAVEDADIEGLRIAITGCMLIHNSMRLKRGVNGVKALRSALGDIFAIDDTVKWSKASGKCESTCPHCSMDLAYRFSRKGSRLRLLIRVKGDDCINFGHFISESRFKLSIDKTLKARPEAQSISYITCSSTSLICVVEYDLTKYDEVALRKRGFVGVFYPPEPFKPQTLFDFKPEKSKEKTKTDGSAKNSLKNQDLIKISGRVLNVSVDLATSHLGPTYCTLL